MDSNIQAIDFQQRNESEASVNTSNYMRPAPKRDITKPDWIDLKLIKETHKDPLSTSRSLKDLQLWEQNATAATVDSMLTA